MIKKIFVTYILYCSMQVQAQTQAPAQTGLVFPNSTANMIVELLRGVMNYGLDELKKAEDKKRKLTIIIEENFEENYERKNQSL